MVYFSHYFSFFSLFLPLWFLRALADGEQKKRMPEASVSEKNRLTQLFALVATEYAVDFLSVLLSQSQSLL